jgi:aspartate/methionine/tyrosine aminotransferase
MAERPGGFELLTCGGFFGWVRHPFLDRSSVDVAHELATRFNTIVVPGTAFLPQDGGTLRISVSNADRDAVALLTERLATLGSGTGAARR